MIKEGWWHSSVGVKGYKAFVKGGINQYGITFEEGKTYTTDGPIGNRLSGKGYHMAESLYTTMKFFLPEDEIVIAEVSGYGSYLSWIDDYKGIQDLLLVETIKVDKFLTKDDVRKIMLCFSKDKWDLYFKMFNLSNEEIESFVEEYNKNSSELNEFRKNYFAKLREYERLIEEEQMNEMALRDENKYKSLLLNKSTKSS